MVPGKYDITIYRGGTFEINIESTNTLDVDLDFEDVYDSIRLHIRPAWVKRPSSNAPLLELTTANGGITIDGTILTLHISAAATAAIAFDEGKYDLELVIAATTDPVAVEKVDKLLYGSVTIIGEKTI